MLSVWAEFRAAISSWIGCGQAWPVWTLVVDRNSANVVVRGPGFTRLWHCSKKNRQAVRRKSEVIADTKRGARRISVSIARCDIFAIGPVRIDDEEMVSFVFNVRIPMAIKQASERFGFDWVGRCGFLVFLVFRVGLAKR